MVSDAFQNPRETSDATVARKRVRDLDAKFEEIVDNIRTGQAATLEKSISIQSVQVAPVHFEGRSVFLGQDKLANLARPYLNKRSGELRWGGFKSIRYSVGLLVSKYGDRTIGSLGREDASAGHQRYRRILFCTLRPNKGKQFSFGPQKRMRLVFRFPT